MKQPVTFMERKRGFILVPGGSIRFPNSHGLGPRSNLQQGC